MQAPVTFVSLRKRPASATEAAGLAAAIRDAARRGRSRILLGDDLCGVRVEGPGDDAGGAAVVHPDRELPPLTDDLVRATLDKTRR